LKKAAAPKKQAPARTTKPEKGLPIINNPPTQVLDIYVFGEGSAGELGLGAGLQKDVMNVKRPRLNQRLGAKSVGVVQVAVGGMHNAALTYDNKILTWGVNDQGALGRETDEGPLVDVDESEEPDDDSDSDSDEEAAAAKAKAKAAMRDSGLNASEAEPREVDSRHFPEGTKFAQLVASDSTTFALTTTGLVYGWGTFRVSFVAGLVSSVTYSSREMTVFLDFGTKVPKPRILQF
jgi:regulator of chromosome condensation